MLLLFRQFINLNSVILNTVFMNILFHRLISLLYIYRVKSKLLHLQLTK